MDAEFKVTLDGILRYLHAVCGYLNIHGLEGYSTIVTKCEKRANTPALIVLMIWGSKMIRIFKLGM